MHIDYGRSSISPLFHCVHPPSQPLPQSLPCRTRAVQNNATDIVIVTADDHTRINLIESINAIDIAVVSARIKITESINGSDRVIVKNAVDQGAEAEAVSNHTMDAVDQGAGAVNDPNGIANA